MLQIIQSILIHEYEAYVALIFKASVQKYHIRNFTSYLSKLYFQPRYVKNTLEPSFASHIQFASIKWKQSTSWDWSNLIFDSPPFYKDRLFWCKLFKNIIALFMTFLLTTFKQQLVDNVVQINVWISFRNLILINYGAKTAKYQIA